MLYYLPLEPYKERYTMQLSAAETGWFERNWLAANVNYKRIQPPFSTPTTPPRSIKTGRVLDAVGRSRWAMGQIDQLLSLADRDYISSTDVIYLDDFWHPGVQALPYLFQQKGIKPRMYAFCWAQSVDQYDFTYAMRDWIRHFERGTAALLDGVFVASTELKTLLAREWVAHEGKVEVVGLPFDSGEVKSRMPEDYQVYTDRDRLSKLIDVSGYPTEMPRKNQVVFSSRWDREKDPQFFCRVAEIVLRETQDVKFVVCSSADVIRSNYPGLVNSLDDMAIRHPHNFQVATGLTKEAYYRILTESKVQFNCADQDWVSFTLLEAVTAGCYPLYPYFRSFPETFDRDMRFMYPKDNEQEAAKKLLAVLRTPDDLWAADQIAERQQIVRRHDMTWMRILDRMQVHFDCDPETRKKVRKEAYAPGAV
jgi:glycosyltransferase involved in cell wall biosynthesis